MTATGEWQLDAVNQKASPEPSGVVFNIQRFSVNDGPGIRTTVFFKGCPLSCWWCHNPESQSFRPALLYFPERCRLCGQCVDFCPNQAVSLCDGHMAISMACTACGSCVDLCRAGARELAGRRMTVSGLAREIEKDVLFFDESGGGATFSGGEPLSQPRFLEALLRACRARGIHTAIETCGFAPPRTVAAVAAEADLVLYDLKLVDSAKHKAFTGRSNEVILMNLAALARTGRPLVVRVAVIPDVNDSEEDLRQVASFLQSIGVHRLDLLPYHQTGLAKYQRLNRPYRLAGLAPPPVERMEQIAAGFERQGFTARIGG